MATYLATDRSLTICNAGHPRPLWRRAGTGSWEYLGRSFDQQGNLPWGLDDETPYHQFSVNLDRGDVVLFYTDALIESADPAGRQLGEAGLLALARGIDGSDPSQAGRLLIEAVAAHRQQREADDDLTVVAWHHNANGPRHPSIGEKLDTYAKVFGLKEY